MPETIIIDCDPGQDDAVMLFLALASPDELHVAGITTVAGNVDLQQTQRNARIICDLAGQSDTPVYAGCKKPLACELVTAEHVHGQTGIDGLDIHDPTTPLQTTHAVDFIIEFLLDSKAPITLVPTGPLTNIASAMQREPAILERIKHIVLMGGAMREGGNITPSAEFNIFVDARAAQAVFASGCPITAVSLDVTHQALITERELDRLRVLDSDVARATVAMLAFYNRFDKQKYGLDGGPLHDPCTIAYLLKPELFKGKRCNVTVETHSALTCGHTAVDFWHVTDKPKTTNWLYAIDAEGFYDLLIARLSRYH